MKTVILSLLLLWAHNVRAQEVPGKDNPQFIRDHNIAGITVTLQSVSELTELDGLEIINIEFNENGDIVSEKTYTIHSAVIYAEQFFNTYDADFRPVESLYKKKFYPENRADSMMLINTQYERSARRVFRYGSDSRLSAELIFSSATSVKPVKEINYVYNDQGLLNQKTELAISSQEQRQKVYREVYYYDKKKRPVNILSYRQSEQKAGKTKVLEYNKKGFVESERVSHYGKEGELKTNKFQNNRLTESTWQRPDRKEKTVLQTVYKYDESGCLTGSESRRNGLPMGTQSYTCNSRGLRETETALNNDGKPTIIFLYEYTYFD